MTAGSPIAFYRNRCGLTPENIAALLNKGRVGLPKAGAPDAETLWRMPCG